MDVLNAIVSAAKQVRDWVDDKKVDKDGNKKLTDENYSSAEKAKVSQMVTGLAILDNKLYLTNDNGLMEETATTLPSGGGGGSSSASVTVINLLPSNEITVAYGSVANLKFEYYSSEDSGNGTAYISINDSLKGTVKIVQGENTIDVSSWINEGINSVIVKCLDSYSNSKSLSYSVNAVSLKLTSTFDDSKIYDGDITMRYTPVGAISKDVHLSIDGIDTIIATTSETNKQQTYVISKSDLLHGAHDIILYLSTTIGDVEIVSNKLYYSVVVVDSSVTTPIISSVCMNETLTQGEQLQIDYLCYDPANMDTEVSIVVYNGDEVYSETKRTVNATKQTFITRDLPTGTVTIKLVYGVIERTHTVTVLESDIDVSIKQTDLEFELKAAGKSNTDNDRDVWENNGVSTVFENINYESTGWVLDDNNNMALRLFGQAKATIQFQPFSKDSRLYGESIEIEFAIRDVNNKDAIAIQCYDGSIGFAVSADTAFIKSEQTSVSCNYTDEEKIHVTFVIESDGESRLLSVYLNGILSGVKQYPSGDNFQQSGNAKYIEIGSPYCSVDLYSIRTYKTALTSTEVLNNYIASITDMTEKLSLYEDNNIYDIYGNLSLEKVKDKIPVVLITCSSLPTYKGDKKNATITFTHPEKPVLNYEDSAKLDIQGTSSILYPKKNYKFKTSSYHNIDTDQIETNVICIKCDYAESTSCRNTASAKYIHILYGDSKIPAQVENSKIRTTIYGYPCLVYWRPDTSTTPEFLYKGNYNYDKSSYEAFAFTPDYPDAFSVEFCNNTSDACRFHGEMPEDWGDDFEYRYPDGYSNIEDSGFKEMHSWVVSTWQDGATGNVLDETCTTIDGTVYTNDTAEYRLAKFKKEFTDHFDMDFALVYYVYTYFGLYIDSRCKNLFLTTFDRQHFYCYFYDMDTSYGINNEGVLAISPWLTDTDIVDGTDTFNGQDSTLWTNFRQAFPNEIQECYKELRSSGLLSYDKLIEYYILNQTREYSASVYNEDSEAKYISMLRENNDASNLYQVRGSGESHFRYFVKNRLKFCDSRWNCGDYPDDFVSLRIYTPSGSTVVEPNANITVTPFNDGFMGVKYKANGTLQQQRANANESVTFIAPSETFNDTETAVYGASQISSLGDLSPLYCGTVNLSKASKLIEVIVGNGTDGYSNTNLKELAVGANKLLKKVDIRNCPNLVDPLELSGCPSIEEVYAEGSGITSVSLPSSGFLKIMHLPDTITNLTVTNQQYIEEFTLEGYDNLTTLHVESAVNIPVEDIMLNAPNLNRVRLLDVMWEAESEDHLRQTIEKFKSCLGLDANGNNTDKAVVTGRVTVPSISDELYNDIYENFPNLVVDDGSGKPYILNYKDRDGNSLYVTRVAEGESAIDPIAEGYIETPATIETETYKYTFIGWSTLPTNISKHYIITAQYSTEFAIKYYNGDTLLYRQWAVQGDSASDPVADGLIEAPTKEGTEDLHYLFSGWDNLPANVQFATSVYAQYYNVYPVRFYTDFDLEMLHYVQWVVEGSNASDPVANGDVEAPTKEGTTDMQYSFLAWSEIPTNVTSIVEVYATYIENWAVRFYNDDVLVYTQWVQNGSNATDPVASGDISTPTRASTAQYDYTFSSWDGDFENVTEARSMTAVYSSTIRCYTVYFYNNDTLLQTVENVQYGSGTSYTGSTPTKLGVDNPEEYVFKGWAPTPTNITGDTICRALFRFTGYIADDWDVIKANAANGTATSLYPIGGRKEFTFTIDGTTYTADVEIIGHDHDYLADGSGEAALTWACKDLPDLMIRFNTTNTNIGGWETSEARTICNGDLYNSFPEKLQAAISEVYKLSDGGLENKTLVTTVDKVFILSYDELAIAANKYSLSGQGEAYSSTFTEDKESRKKYLSDGTTAGYITRSSYLNDNSAGMIWRVTNTGGTYSDLAFNKFNACFGFCIG